MTNDDNDSYYGSGGEEEDGNLSDIGDALMDYDDGFIDNASDDSDNFASSHQQQQRTQKFKVLAEDDLKKLQEEAITEVSTVLSVSRVAASILLRRYNWNVNKVNDEWFADEEKVRKTVGLPESPVSLPNAEETTCGICFDDFPSDKIYAANCGHPFCSSCWEGYIGSAINDGPGCLMLCCPDPSCRSAVDQEMVNKLASADDKRKYNRYLVRSFVEDNKKIKWCPGPGCEYALDFIGGGGGNYDVTCNCSHSFCWNCVEEAHRPVCCETVSKWLQKNNAESENMTWILANSKPCPKCKRPIEKNQGCMHMTCSAPCRFEFCWLCLGSWQEHGEETGGFYSCNRYEAAKEEGEYDEDEKRREMARSLLERYYHYYERYATNQSSRRQAFENLHQLEEVDLAKLGSNQCQPESQLKFITEAWLQIVECRRVLMWTYAYGYFLPPGERAKKRFFEYLQGEAEAGLERLHKCAEKEFQTFLESEGPLEEFNEFRIKLAGLTSVTKNYFENLVRALENGLADVDSHAASNEPESPPRVIDMSAFRRGRGTGEEDEEGEGGEDYDRDYDSRENSPEPRPRPRSDINAVDHWYCDYCTFANPMSATHCEVCEQARFSAVLE